MVEADIQILGGIAVTVFLALMFFGVVVLWDVALALRSVGDKIDKLEDNIDDDLKDIGHSLDGMSGATGGGTQLHLSGGGTISPGPAAATPPQHGPHPASQQPSRRADSADQSVGGHQQEAHQRSPQPPHEPSAHVSHPGQSGYDGDVRESDSRSVPRDSPPDEAGAQREDVSANEGDVDRAAEATDQEPAGPDDSEAEPGAPHPRAAANRGRFVTSPDRTPWYGTPIDREAIASALSPIVGELEAAPSVSTDDVDADGNGGGRGGADVGGTDSDGSVPIEAGPVAADEEPIAVGPAGLDGESATTEDAEIGSTDADDETGSTNDEHAAVSTDEGNEADTGDASIDVGSTSPGDGSEFDEIDGDEATTSESDGEPGFDLEDASDEDSREDGRSETDESTIEPEDQVGAAVEFEADSASPTEDTSEQIQEEVPDEPIEDEDEDPASDVDDGRETADDSPDDADASVDSSDVDAPDESDITDETDSPDETNLPRETDFSDETGSADDTDAAADTYDGGVSVDGSDGEIPDEFDGTDAAGPIDESHTEFSFDEEIDESAAETSLSLDEAVETVNTEEPALSRSSHGVETSAESDEEGTVLVFTFDPETVDAGESTKRLLRYQLRSFADQSSTPDGDVTVDGNRIVIQIPDADGNAVSRWRDAAVQVIDRTMYLSDNSE